MGCVRPPFETPACGVLLRMRLRDAALRPPLVQLASSRAVSEAIRSRNEGWMASSHSLLAMTQAASHSTSSGQGTMVDFTVFIAMASATARLTPSSENG